jgi:hypothetical protein
MLYRGQRNANDPEAEVTDKIPEQQFGLMPGRSTSI